MKNTRAYTGIGAAVGMMILILDGKTAVSGATRGVDLCLRTVIPSLFPFFVLSGLLTSAFLGSKFPVSLKCFGVPQGAETLAIAGFLGGYPVGAQNIAAAYRNGSLSRSTAQRMLGFCNNAGPSFLFGMIGPMFPSAKYAWALWGIHIVSALLVGFLLTGETEKQVSIPKYPPPGLSQALRQAISVMGSVCGWIILFRIILAFLNRWVFWLLPQTWQVAVTGLLELSNGCVALMSVEDIGWRFLICAGILGFGGLCVTMQTISVTADLSLRYYFPGKLLQTAFSILLCRFFIPYRTEFVVILLIYCIFLGLILRKMQNNSSIPLLIGV